MWEGYIAGMGEARNAYRILFLKSDGKRLLAKLWQGWSVLIGLDLAEDRVQ
jgi:hypothetical protein